MEKYKLGEFIYRKRKKQNLTQDELGRKLGVTNKAVSKWETGETLPEVTMLIPLANILQISVDELLTQEDKEEIVIKKKRINFTLIALIILLMICEAITIGIFMFKNSSHIEVSNDNLKDYLIIDSLDFFEVNNQVLKLNQSYKLNNEYIVIENIDFTISYTIDFYYYKDDDTIGIITYYNRTSEKSLVNNDTVIDSIELQPKNDIPQFKGILKIETEYEIISSTGLLERR